MRWAAFILLLANLGVAGYLLLVDRQPRTDSDLRVLELNADKVKLLNPPPAPATDGKGPRSNAGACLEWGTFTAAELERAQEQLAKLKPSRVSVRELAEAPAWWVYVPPFKTREEAERRLREIEEAGNKEARLVAEGDRWRNAISLGIFKSEDAATAYLARMKELKVRNAAVVRRNDLLKLSAIVIADPQPALVARVMELKANFEGTDVKAAACPAGTT